MKAKDLKKLHRAIELVKKAEKLVDEISLSNKKFRYSPNSNFRSNRLIAAISILETEFADFNSSINK